MSITTRTAILLIFPLMITGLIACGTEGESVASGGAEPAVVNTPQVEVESTIDDHADDADAHAEETVLAAHDEEPHDDSISDSHEDEASEAASHAHAAASEVDPDAPVIHIFGSEFGYESVSTEVEAEHPFTIMFHNEGMLEHDITFEGMEEMGGIHLQPGEDGKATFSLTEAGDYSYYCTVPGHLEAGMMSALTVVANVPE